METPIDPIAETPGDAPAEPPPAPTVPVNGPASDTAMLEPGEARITGRGIAVGLGLAAVVVVIALQVVSVLGLNRSNRQIDDLTDSVAALESSIAGIKSDFDGVGADIENVGDRLESLEASAGGLFAAGPTSSVSSEESEPTATDGPVLGTVSGTEYYSGETVSYAPDDGIARVYMVWAHWCPYCQTDLTQMKAWYPANADAFENVELVTVTTFMDETRGNPLDQYLETEQFPFPVIMDPDSAVAIQLGNTGSVPYWLFVNVDGTIIGQHAGALPEGALTDLFTQIDEIAAQTL